MRIALASCIALSALAMPAMAQVTITTGPTPYWREHSDWSARPSGRRRRNRKDGCAAPLMTNIESRRFPHDTSMEVSRG